MWVIISFILFFSFFFFFSDEDGLGLKRPNICVDDVDVFYTGQQAAILVVLFAARSVDLDRRQQLREMGGGVDDLLCCVTHI